MRSQAGNLMLEAMFVIAVVAMIGAGLFAKYGPERRATNADVTRINAVNLLHAAAAYWSKYRTAPPSASALAMERLYDVARAPTNPIGGPFAVRIDSIGATSARIVVSATITEPGALTEWQQRLNADTINAGSLEWHLFVREQATLAGIRGETFRAMY